MLTPKDYDSSVDIWSAGCIFGEMLLGRPLFPGAHEINQLHLILDSIGKEDITNNKSFITDGHTLVYGLINGVFTADTDTCTEADKMACIELC